MTFRTLLEMMKQFAAAHPDHEALDRRVVVRVSVDDGDSLHVGGLSSVSVDAGCTDRFSLVLDADQSPDDDDIDDED